MDPLIYVDFTGIYEKYGELYPQGRILSCGDIPGTDKYCDDEAQESIEERLKASGVGPEGIHFIDNGNYHYMSRLFTRMIREPYGLVMFDNHTDMQAPAFGDILSCGSWLLEVLKRDEYMKQLVLIGPSEDRLTEVEAVISEMGPDRIRVVSRDEWECGRTEDHHWTESLPLYFSVDLDVLCTEDFYSNWDQGTMSLEACLTMIQKIAKGHRIMGADICGGPERSEVEAGLSEEILGKNAEADQALLRLLRDWEA